MNLIRGGNTMSKRLRTLVCTTLITSIFILGGNMNTYAKNEINTNDGYELNVNMDEKTVDVSDMLTGIFFEDINHGADGGLYSQLIENNSFESKSSSINSWTVNAGSDGYGKIVKAKPLNENNPSYMQLHSTANSKVSITNDGYKGINIENGKYYDFYFFADNIDNTNHQVEIKLVDSKGNTVSNVQTITTNSNSWTKYETQLTANTDVADARLCITMKDEGKVDLDMISLFPSANDTWHQRKFGLRKDLVERLQELHPRFMRFPGGCVIEGTSKDEMYNWKDTIGKIEERKANSDLWGYDQSYGLGFYEYFQLCEDLNMAPVPVLNCGMTCQARGKNGVPTYSASDEELDKYIQDALDLVEYANGDVTTTWGSKRAEAGHYEPFNLKYIAIGNEQWGDDYEAKFEKFQEAFKEKYPEIQLITCVGPSAEGQIPTDGWEWVKEKANTAMVDEHYYMSPEWFESHTHRYDSYDRNGAKVYLGEYASQSNTLKSALAEGAYLTGIEKNSDIVKMSSYAPLFAKSDDYQWTPNMIWFNGKENFGSANFYMQKLFSNNLGTEMLKDDFKAPDITNKNYIKGGTCLGAWSTQVQYDNLKVTNNDTSETETIFEDNFDDKDLSNWESVNGNWYVDDEGKLRLDDIVDNCKIQTKAKDWSNYTIEVDAKKLSGKEGFLVGFGVNDADNYYWFNVGGWGNTSTAIEHGIAGSKSTISTASSKYGTVETGKTYKLKVVVNNDNVKCYIDGTLTNDVTVDSAKQDVFTSSSYDEANKEVILKIINISGENKDININLDGSKKLANTAKVQYITSNSDKDLNSFSDPEKVSIKEKTIDNVCKEFTYNADKYSATVIRIKAE